MAMEKLKHLGIRGHHLVLGLQRVHIERLVEYQRTQFLATKHHQVKPCSVALFACQIHRFYY